MSTRGGPGIVTDGLMFLADAGNHSSFPGSGTSWTELLTRTIGTLTSISVVNGHLNFDGASSTVNFDIEAISDMWVGGATSSGWIRAESDGENNLGRVHDTNNIDNGTLVYLSNESAGFMKIQLAVRYTSGFGIWSTSNLEIPVGEFVHYAITFDSDSPATPPIFYINGVSVAVSTDTAPTGTIVSDSGNPIFIGQSSTATNRTFDGDIDYIVLYSKALSASEILQNYNALKGRFR